MNFDPPKQRRDISSILTIMENLRDPNGGCPWDLEQTSRSIAPYAIEEAYELADAIERDDVEDIKDELGDNLLQVVFHAQMAKEAEQFDFADVVQAISDKMVRRHPHVFKQENSQSAETPEQVLQNWDDIKAAEKQQKNGGDAEFQSILDDVPVGLPATTRAVKLQKKAAKQGFDWPDTEGVISKIKEEVEELEEAMAMKNKAEIEAEFGDVLFSLINLARFLKIDPEKALRGTNQKFTNRFQFIEQQLHDKKLDMTQMTLDELDKIWDQAKQVEKEALS